MVFSDERMALGGFFGHFSFHSVFALLCQYGERLENMSVSATYRLYCTVLYCTVLYCTVLYTVPAWLCAVLLAVSGPSTSVSWVIRVIRVIRVRVIRVVSTLVMCTATQVALQSSCYVRWVGGE